MKHLMILSCVLLMSLFSVSSCNEKEEVKPNSSGPDKVFNPGSIAMESCEGNEEEDPLPMLAGTVKNSSSTPISGACVELRNTSHQTLALTGSDGSGHYFFNNLSNGSYYLLVNATGYSPQTVYFSVSGGNAQVLHVTMQ